MHGVRSVAVVAALLLATACGAEGEGAPEEAGAGGPEAAAEAPAGDGLDAAVTVDTQKIAADSAKK